MKNYNNSICGYAALQIQLAVRTHFRLIAVPHSAAADSAVTVCCARMYTRLHVVRVSAAAQNA